MKTKNITSGYRCAVEKYTKISTEITCRRKRYPNIHYPVLDIGTEIRNNTYCHVKNRK